MSKEFETGVAIVAGGSGGIGATICQVLAENGSHVALTYRSNAKAANEAAEAVRALGREAIAVSVDHADSAAMKAFVDDAAAKFGRIHSVVYAAGPHLPLKFVSAITPEEWRKVFDIDVNGAFNLVWATLPHLKKGGGGGMAAVITAAVEKVPARDIFSAAPKAAIEMLFRGVALEEGRFNIRANCVGPGFINAGVGNLMLTELEEQGYAEGLRKGRPLKRFGEARDIAEAVVFLLSQRAKYITGQSLAVDGGMQL